MYVLVHLQEPSLRATQYLPDILRLQQCLYDSFHHRLDRREAKKMTIGEFLQTRQHGEQLTNYSLPADLDIYSNVVTHMILSNLR